MYDNTLCLLKNRTEQNKRPGKGRELQSNTERVSAPICDKVNPTNSYVQRFMFFFPSLDLSVHTADSLTPDGSPLMPSLGIPLKLCAPRAIASGSSLGHVPAHLASPGDCGTAGALLHARLELGDHWHLRPDRDGSWYGAFSLPSGSGGTL